MKKYTIRVESTEYTYVEVIANSDQEALEKVQEMDYDEHDWCQGGMCYDVEDSETVEFTNEDAMAEIRKKITLHGLVLVTCEDGSYALRSKVLEEDYDLPLVQFADAKEFIDQLERLYLSFKPDVHAVLMIKKLMESGQEERAARNLYHIASVFAQIREKLFYLLESLQNKYSFD